HRWLGRRRELLAPVQRGEEGDAHEDARGDAGQERAGKPPRGDFATVRRPAPAVAYERRLIAERFYGPRCVLHPLGRASVLSSERLLSATTFDCRNRPSQRSGSR